MLDQVETIFDGMVDMMKKLKKSSYEKNMAAFRARNGHFFQEMIQYVEETEGKDNAAKEIADIFVSAVEERFSVKGKMKSRTQADLNFFMIYYVFPAILLVESGYSDLVAANIRDMWRNRFKNSNIDYADYDRIYSTFREKIFGIF